MLRNPFFVYIATFAGAIGFYLLKWADVYPPLTADFYAFFGLTFIVAAAFGRLIKPDIEGISDYRPGILHWSAGLFVIATFLGELALAGGVPILLVAGGAKFYNMEAVAIHLHAFMFWSIYSTIRFADFLYTKRKLYLAEAAMPVVFYFLMVYRGPAIICLITWFFVYVIKEKRIRPIPIISVAALVAAALFVNGAVGDVRSPGQEHIAKPSKTFKELGLPGAAFWAYLYGTAPLGNLQLSVTKMTEPAGNLREFVISEFIPDTISKKILPMLNPDIKSGVGNLQTRDDLYSWKQHQIAEGINTSSIFGRAYGFLGWAGCAIMFAALSLFIVVYLLLIQNSPYNVAALAWLNTTVMFCLLNNMMVSAVTLLPMFLLAVLPPWNLQSRFRFRRA